MKNWIPKNLVTFFLLTVFLFATIYFSSLFFVSREIGKIESYYSDTESKSGREERSKIIKSFVENNGIYLNTLRSFFIKKGDEILVIEEIENLAKSSNLKFMIDTIDEGGVKEEQELIKENINIRMTLEGNWINIMSFINKLERMRFGTSIKSFTLNKKDSQVWESQVQFVVFREK